MKLTELDPQWIHPGVLAFLCPHCRKDWLTCKNIILPQQELYDIYERHFGEDWNIVMVPCRADYAWNITGDFSNLSISPSVDASASGHWHGWVTSGEMS